MNDDDKAPSADVLTEALKADKPVSVLDRLAAEFGISPQALIAAFLDEVYARRTKPSPLQPPTSDLIH
jgi:hypothetical protein